ncbi:MAG: hypothetical protein VBE63_17965 [Lamprobacter sp.]|uniref:hypothetical protein n=1 Tax=Lamprobacter sp. TaxID=3100796 RepID=UPI002B259528|nr:hypothetical protein [Lamprobacter sp.]MEA3641803.1 hypothetical protein [Lamprobacter sp.]
MLQLDRVVELYLLLPKYPRKLSVSELHQRLINRGPDFNVCRRTVERDLVDLMGSRHFGVVTDGAKPAGWYRDPQISVFSDHRSTNQPAPVGINPQPAAPELGCVRCAAEHRQAAAEPVPMRCAA